MSSIEIDGMSLIKHERDSDTGATKEIRSVYNISIGEKRRIVEHKIPGLNGNILQDLGRDPVRISFEGLLFGEKTKEDMKALRDKFKTGAPVPFLSTLSDIAEVKEVLIEELNVEDLSSVTNTYKYFIVLREHVTPQEETQKQPTAQQQEAKDNVSSQADQAKKEKKEESEDKLTQTMEELEKPEGKTEQTESQTGEPETKSQTKEEQKEAEVSQQEAVEQTSSDVQTELEDTKGEQSQSNVMDQSTHSSQSKL